MNDRRDVRDSLSFCSIAEMADFAEFELAFVQEKLQDNASPIYSMAVVP